MDMAAARNLSVRLLNADAAVANTLEAARWWAAQQEATPCLACPNEAKPRFDQSLVARLVSLRVAAERLLFGGGAQAEPDALGTLNACLGLGRLELREGAVQMAALQGGAPVLAPLAYAVALVASGRDRDRLRRCREKSCRTYFWDETKNGSRRWCSLRCMERERAPRRRLRR